MKIWFVLNILLCPFFVHAQTSSFADDFEEYQAKDWGEGTINGNWFVNFSGYGHVGVAVDESRPPGKSKVHFQRPKASTSANETHASLVTSVATMEDFQASLKVKTVKQLRTPSPNAWEAAWVLWHYSNNNSFYYFILKPNGWELGKEDAAYPGSQRFLQTGAAPKLVLDQYNEIQIQQTGATIKISIDGEPLTVFTDGERPYLTGKFALYNEDAYVFFDNVSVHSDSVSLVGERTASMPHNYFLYQNYPNPFNPRTTISFELANTVQVRMEIFSLEGKLVRTLVDGRLAPGRYSAVWDGTDTLSKRVSSGTYFIRFVAGNYRIVKKAAFIQ